MASTRFSRSWCINLRGKTSLAPCNSDKYYKSLSRLIEARTTPTWRMDMPKPRAWTRRVTWLSLRQLCELREVLSLASGLITPLVTREDVMGQTVRDLNPQTELPSSWKFGIQCCINHMQFLHVFMYLYTSYSMKVNHFQNILTQSALLDLSESALFKLL